MKHPLAASIPLGPNGDPKDIGQFLVYNPYYIPVGDDKFLSDRMHGYRDASPVIRAIIRQFVNCKKIIGSFSLAHHVIKSGLKDPTSITDDDIMWAYAIGAGGGMEYEWPYE